MKSCYLILFMLLLQSGFAQPGRKAQGSVFVDQNGTMRWTLDQREVQGFGVNYTLPFAHAFRATKNLGIAHQRAIDQDVAQFARLGFDLFRVHVWDTEISDTLGNVTFNEHLNALDYLLWKLAERDISYVLTPIAFWGNGWPEPDEDTPGFSRKYGKEGCLTHPEAIRAQENYLTQFLQHVNPYTRIAYKDDPRLIAVEISNEPHHQGPPEAVSTYIGRMVKAVRKSGFANPVFYNVSHSIHFAEQYFGADIQGGTFQWYPTGLGYQKELPLNVLPHVDRYPIPFEEVIRKHKAAKLVYEFDAADIGKSYVYPAMARSMRSAGIQIATHFAYDPTSLAFANTEYNTHYMNLAYTPSKALALMISAEVFRSVPMYSDFGAYPGNSRFGDFMVSYTEDLALLNTPELFYHTNTTSAVAAEEKSLRRIAGCGNSPLVRYDGTGAYFLDKIAEGTWRLEVMPDALIVENPYGRNSLQKTVAVLQGNEREMQISLANLGADFSIAPLNAGNKKQVHTARNGELKVSPGVYLLTRSGIPGKTSLPDRLGNLLLKEFNGPPTTASRTYVVHSVPEKVPANAPLEIAAEVLTLQPSPKVRLLLSGNGPDEWIEMTQQSGFRYTAVLPAEKMEAGLLNYYIVVESNGKSETFPSGRPGTPQQWDFTARQTYAVRVFDPAQPIVLFGARSDWNQLSYTQWLPTLKPVPLGPPHEAAYQIRAERLPFPNGEPPEGSGRPDYTVHQYLNHQIDHLRPSLSGKNTLVVLARSLSGQPVPVQVALIGPDGSAHGAILEIGEDMQEYEIPLSDLKPVQYVLMPRPYPTFLPYDYRPSNAVPFNLQAVEGLQISLGPGLPREAWAKPQGIALSRIWVK